MSKKKEYVRQDKFYTQAKDEGFASRASFKLIELDKKFRLLRRGHKVLDLGAWPGGWMQVVAPIIGPNGVVVGIDFKAIDEIKTQGRLKTLVGDVSDETIQEQALAFCGSPFDVILSDMSPKLTGIRIADEGALSNCYDAALGVAYKCLKQGGSLVVKAFKGNEAHQFSLKLREGFNIVKRCELDSSRKSSNEYYIVCLNFKDGTPCQSQPESADLGEEQ